jgi:hypothetical protein
VQRDPNFAGLHQIRDPRGQAAAGRRS